MRRKSTRIGNATGVHLSPLYIHKQMKLGNTQENSACHQQQYKAVGENVPALLHLVLYVLERATNDMEGHTIQM